MNLRNPFTLETRKLYIGIWYCWECGGNGTNNGGLELHHIMGRISSSAFNSALLCHGCHSKMCHSQEEEQRLFRKTLIFLFDMKYVLNDNDISFIMQNEKRLIDDETVKLLNSYRNAK